MIYIYCTRPISQTEVMYHTSLVQKCKVGNIFDTVKLRRVHLEQFFKSNPPELNKIKMTITEGNKQ
jgi:hypothetical protein